MHLLDLYATSSSSTIDKPYIYETFFPLPDEKYITFQAQTKFDSKDYSYWQDVINILYPILSKANIKIIQIGLSHEKAYQYTVDFRGKTSVNQLAYIIRNSSLHLGSDSLGVHLASGYDIPIVALYSIIQASVAGPKFSSQKKVILFESFVRTGNKKPSYSPQENPKSVNLIKPEEIVNAVIELLGLNFKIPFETVYIGKQYGYEKIRDFIPDQVAMVENPQVPIEIRMDLSFNEENLFKQLSVSKGVIITDRTINIDILTRMKKNVASLIYEVKENDDASFLQNVKNLGIPIALISYLSEDKLKDKKINYYQIGNITRIQPESEEKINELRKDIENLYYRSNKLVHSNGKTYLSNFGRINNIPLNSNFDFQKVSDNPEFWHELNYMHIIKRLV